MAAPVRFATNHRILTIGSKREPSRPTHRYGSATRRIRGYLNRNARVAHAYHHPHGNSNRYAGANLHPASGANANPGSNPDAYACPNSHARAGKRL